MAVHSPRDVGGLTDEWPLGCPPVYWTDEPMEDWERNVMADMLLYGWVKRDGPSLTFGSGARVWQFYRPEYIVVTTDRARLVENAWHPDAARGEDCAFVFCTSAEYNRFSSKYDVFVFHAAQHLSTRNHQSVYRDSQRTRWWKSLPWSVIAMAMADSG